MHNILISFYHSYKALILYDFKNFRILRQFILSFDKLLPDLVSLGYFRILLLKVSGVNVKFDGYSYIRKGFFIEKPENFKIYGSFNCNRNLYADCNGLIIIEKNVRIAEGVKFLTLSHSGSNEIDVIKPIYIKENAHIGAGAIILGGAILERNSVLAPNSVLIGNTKESGIYMGNPARLVGFK